jgi:hypothetical protein
MQIVQGERKQKTGRNVDCKCLGRKDYKTQVRILLKGNKITYSKGRMVPTMKPPLKPDGH